MVQALAITVWKLIVITMSLLTAPAQSVIAPSEAVSHATLDYQISSQAQHTSYYFVSLVAEELSEKTTEREDFSVVGSSTPIPFQLLPNSLSLILNLKSELVHLPWLHSRSPPLTISY